MNTALARSTLLESPLPLIVENTVEWPIKDLTSPTMVGQVASLLVTSLASRDFPAVI
jgi:hypothetical protein